jgi:hypothetical protein
MRSHGQPEFTCEVRVQYLPEQSQPPEGPFAFAYTVTIRNTGDVTAQLVARHWVVTDADGRREDVRGLAWWATSRCSSPASISNTPAGRASPRRTARCAAPSSA